MILPNKKFLTKVLAASLFCLCFLLVPGSMGRASADLKLPNDKDNTKIEQFCADKLGKNASRSDKGACFEGYILGLRGDNKDACDNDFKHHPSAIRACKTGYSAGQNNAAHVTPPGGGVGAGAGGGGAGPGGTADTCGSGDGIKLSINIGCQGKGNAIADAAFAIIRVLSAGVGLVIVGSIVVGGIQYSASRGDPQATALAIGRIRSSLLALMIFIFAYAILNFIIPNGFLN